MERIQHRNPGNVATAEDLHRYAEEQAKAKAPKAPPWAHIDRDKIDLGRITLNPPPRDDGRRWTIMPVPRNTTDQTTATEFLEAIVNAMEGYEELARMLQDALQSQLENFLPGVNCGQCELTPDMLGDMLRGGGIHDFTRGIAIVDAVRELFENARGDAPAKPNEGMSDFLSDPSLSLETKLMLLMAKLAEDLDEQIEKKMKDVDKATRSKPNGQDSNVQKVQTELQDLMNRRRQMFSTVQNLLKSLHDTSMSSIRNLKA